MKNIRKTRSDSGITLIALVVTIIILLVLAGVTLGTVLSDGGLIDKTKEAIAEHEKAQEKEKEELSKSAGMMKNLIDGLGNTVENRPLVSTVTSTEHEDNKEVQDSLGNPLVIPSGFKHKEGTNVEDGIVIEDANQNQFVWIPVSNIDGDNNADTNPTATDLIKLASGEKVEITLGRYTFKNKYNGTQSLSDGTPELVQRGSESDSDDDSYKFSWTYLIGSTKNTYGDYKENTSLTRTNGGVGAKDLAGFVQSVQDNHGYYLARYEAGKGNNGKPVSKVVAVWNNITQPEASEASQKMYEEEVNYTSDLVNSYAWDTAIVYIQAVKEENENYANADRGTNTTLKNTGATGDEKCHIFDMAGNVAEWTTEYSTNTIDGISCPCVVRGGNYYDSIGYAARRSDKLRSDRQPQQPRVPSTFIFKVALDAEKKMSTRI